MNRIAKGLLYLFALSILLALLFCNTTYANPAMTSHDCRPQNHTTTGGVSVTSPTNAYDGDTGTYATFRYDPTTAGTFEVRDFTTPGTNEIAYADFKLRYAADAGGGTEEYRILYRVYRTEYLDAESWNYLRDFSGTGTSPYVDAEDHPTNYISASNNSISGVLSFTNTPTSWSVVEVILEVDCWSDYGSATTGNVSVWDDSASQYVTYSLPFPGSKPADGVYQTVDVSSIIKQRAEVLALKIEMGTPETEIATYIVDYVRVKVTWKSDPTVLQTWTTNAYALNTRVWLDQQEPYDGVWDWTDINNIRIIVETGYGSGGSSDFDEYEAWVTVYSYRRSTMYVDPSSQTDPSSPFTVTIKIQNVDDLYSWEFKLYYDNSILSNGSVTEGTFLSSQGSTFFKAVNNTDTYNATHGRFWVTCTLQGVTTGVSGSGTLATIGFTVDGPSGTTGLNLTDTRLVGLESANTRFTYMVHDTTDGSVTISAVPEFPLGAALEIALVVAIVYVWWSGKKRPPSKALNNAPTQTS